MGEHSNLLELEGVIVFVEFVGCGFIWEFIVLVGKFKDLYFEVGVGCEWWFGILVVPLVYAKYQVVV